MNNEQLLNDFIDGTLDFGDEVSLFAELSTNEHLRGDLRTLLLIQRGVRNSAFAFVPMRSESEEIFRQLGFSHGDGRRIRSGAAGWDRFGRVLHGITGGIVGVLLTLLFMMWQPQLFTSGEKVVTQSGSASAVGSAGDSQPTASAAGVSKSEAAATIERNDQMPAESRETARSIGGSRGRGGVPASHAQSAPRRNGAQSSIVQQSPSIIHEASTTEHETPTAVDTAQLSPSMKPAEMRRPKLEHAMEEEKDLASGGSHSPLDEAPITTQMPIELEIRALDARSFERIPAPLDQGSKTLLNDVAIAARYNLSESFSAGIEFGQEMFYQKFQATASNGDLVEYRQNPLLPWFALVARYNLYRSGGLNPYVQASLGATQVGPMARMMVGGYYEILPELRLAAGFEMSGIGFKEEEKWYLSRKYGVTYGLSVNF